MTVWRVGAAYEAYVGRWSARIAALFVPWLGVPAGGRWLDAGCGTGALTESVLGHASPAFVCGADPSAGFLDAARRRTPVPLVRADARSLPYADGVFDAVAGGLMLNFVPEPGRAVAEFARVTAPGGVVGAYVWDYAEGMALMRHFWDAAVLLDPGAVALDEGRRFTLCRPGPLAALWAAGGLSSVTVEPLEIPTVFADFDDLWQPFLGGQGTAPAYVASLDDGHRDELRELLRTTLPTGPIALTARAWAVRGTVSAGANSDTR